jgi:transcriptional regulator CtsR
VKVTEIIEQFIKRLLTEAHGGTIDLQRNELASQLGCAPSQINYVISTRFTTENGYIVESRRGGGGYIRITRINLGLDEFLMHILNSIGNSISAAEAQVFVTNCLEGGAINGGDAGLIAAAISDNSLSNIPQPMRDSIRARIFKNMLITLIE